jgi:hypothetical protein
MSNASSSLAQALKKWDTLNSAIKPLLSELPTAVKDQADFEAAIAHIRELGLTQQNLTGQVRDTIKLRLAEQHNAVTLADRLASHLRAKFGSRSDLLLQFAVPPRRTGRRKKKPPVEVPPAVPETPAPEVRPKA